MGARQCPSAVPEGDRPRNAAYCRDTARSNQRINEIFATGPRGQSFSHSPDGLPPSIAIMQLLPAVYIGALSGFIARNPIADGIGCENLPIYAMSCAPAPGVAWRTIGKLMQHDFETSCGEKLSKPARFHADKTYNRKWPKPNGQRHPLLLNGPHAPSLKHARLPALAGLNWSRSQIDLAQRHR